MKEVIKSNKGFYVGDICYALDDIIYHGVWGKADYTDGKYTEPAGGMQFAVAGTAYGDGEYYDQFGRQYGVDAGVIGIVPCELVKPEYTNGGQIFEGAGEAIFEADDGVFNITLPNGKNVYINTCCDEDDEEYYED